MQRLQVKRSTGSGRGFLSALLTYLPGAWIQPSSDDLVSLYKLRYRMALEDRKYDSAMIFLNKILEVDPMNVEAKFCKGEIYHRHLGDFGRAVEQYNKVLRLTASNSQDSYNSRARNSLTELMELLS